jgi:hypothetical protein
MLPLSLSPAAYKAAHWTLEHMSPWALRQGGGMFRKWREQKEIQRKMDEMVQIAEAMIPEEAIRVTATCTPQSSEGLIRDELVFGLNILSLAQVGIRPVRIDGLAVSLHWSDRNWGAHVGTVAVAPERTLALKTEYLTLGAEHVEVIRGNVSWHKEGPPTYAAVSLGVSGILTLHSLWKAEYKPARFSSAIFVRVIEGSQAAT